MDSAPTNAALATRVPPCPFAMPLYKPQQPEPDTYTCRLLCSLCTTRHWPPCITGVASQESQVDIVCNTICRQPCGITSRRQRVPVKMQMTTQKYTYTPDHMHTKQLKLASSSCSGTASCHCALSDSLHSKQLQLEQLLTWNNS